MISKSNETANEFFLLIFFLSITVITFIVIISKYVINKTIKKYITENSDRLKRIFEINSNYSFYYIREKICINTLKFNSKQKYDRFINEKYDNALFECYNNNKMYYDDCFEKAEKNNILLSEYKLELVNIPDYIDTSKKIRFRIFKKRINEYEIKITNENTLKPVTDPIFQIEKTYTSPQGRNTYTDKKEYNIESFKTVISEFQQKNKVIDTAKIERSKMSPSLRYEILKRDSFRCQICGRCQKDGVKLHVDHIKPVSKGGKTEPDNLRTLCEDCNMGKRDSYDEDGIN